jgi:cell shape-determining protein MreC
MTGDEQQRHERDVKDARNTAAELQRVLRENRRLRKRIEELEER